MTFGAAELSYVLGDSLVYKYKTLCAYLRSVSVIVRYPSLSRRRLDLFGDPRAIPSVSRCELYLRALAAVLEPDGVQSAHRRAPGDLGAGLESLGSGRLFRIGRMTRRSCV